MCPLGICDDLYTQRAHRLSRPVTCPRRWWQVPGSCDYTSEDAWSGRKIWLSRGGRS